MFKTVSKQEWLNAVSESPNAVKIDLSPLSAPRIAKYFLVKYKYNNTKHIAGFAYLALRRADQNSKITNRTNVTDKYFELSAFDCFVSYSNGEPELVKNELVSSYAQLLGFIKRDFISKEDDVATDLIIKSDNRLFDKAIMCGAWTPSNPCVCYKDEFELTAAIDVSDVAFEYYTDDVTDLINNRLATTELYDTSYLHHDVGVEEVGFRVSH